MYKLFVRPILFLFSPEKIHHWVTASLSAIEKIAPIKNIIKNFYTVEAPGLAKNVMGIHFPNPVGLAAGFDKDASLFNSMHLLGFGFIEIGTVTPKAQEGNPKPRMFRLSEDQGLINRMGFNNKGLANMIFNLKNRNPNIIIGGNIGKNKLTPNEEAQKDYETCFEGLFEYVDYFVVNVSSPNTPNLRALQEKEPLKKLLNGLQELNKNKAKGKPILLKIAPDLADSQLDDIVDIIIETKLSGVIATNTTINREGLKTSADKIKNIGMGGLSGKPLEKRSTEVIKYLSEKGKNKFVIIGVGGINSADDALKKIEAGADLVQIYSGFIYEGPGLIKRINEAILKQKKQSN